jgi:hypothetical protein
MRLPFRFMISVALMVRSLKMKTKRIQGKAKANGRIKYRNALVRGG